MDIQNIVNKYPSNTIENFYKFSSGEFPKSTVEEMYSDYSTRFESKNKSNSNKNVKKKVNFNKNVTVINIQSYKKEIRKNYFKNKTDVFDEELISDDRMKCVNCNIF